ncbi:sugar-binding transcriptional regulator [Bacillus sp. Marseille-P3661]|uniref:sugar-binding transcriptional regulator n=1 Tax=Bacillus sp. Marseille-P3661 TaxID=1936234 RepID=UPI0015E184C0|nr:sugar-binding transcriptional regulator [Bacillus sp. Marseille-P3661]
MNPKELKPRELKQLSLLADVANLYYEHDLTQAEIAEKLFISRTRISRLLKQAKEKGIVEIKVNYLFERNYDLEANFKERFKLKDVILLNSNNKSEKDIRRGIGSLAAAYLKKRVRKNMTLGVSWGSTISETVNALEVEKKLPINIVQTMGVSSIENPKVDSREIIRRLTEIYSGRAHYLSAPLYIQEQYVKEAIMSDPLISKSLEMLRNADIILTGIGTLNEAKSANPWHGYMNKKMYKEIQKQGGVGCICAQFFDQDGNEIDSDWNRQCIGIRLNQLKRVEEVVAVAGGLEKALPIIGAIKGNYINVLISDTETARAIMSKF